MHACMHASWPHVTPHTEICSRSAALAHRRLARQTNHGRGRQVQQPGSGGYCVQVHLFCILTAISISGYAKEQAEQNPTRPGQIRDEVVGASPTRSLFVFLASSKHCVVPYSAGYTTASDSSSRTNNHRTINSCHHDHDPTTNNNQCDICLHAKLPAVARD